MHLPVLPIPYPFTITRIFISRSCQIGSITECCWRNGIKKLARLRLEW